MPLIDHQRGKGRGGAFVLNTSWKFCENSVKFQVVHEVLERSLPFAVFLLVSLMIFVHELLMRTSLGCLSFKMLANFHTVMRSGLSLSLGD